MEPRPPNNRKIPAAQVELRPPKNRKIPVTRVELRPPKNRNSTGAQIDSPFIGTTVAPQHPKPLQDTLGNDLPTT